MPLLVLATLAAIIASQAIISGSFSLTRQAVQLGYLPRMEIVHTSATEIGQIYIPAVNGLLAVATIAVVVGFRSSSNVAGAYGVALTTTMLITTLLAAVVARKIWRWPVWVVALVTATFLVPDLAFFGASLLKIPDGGWYPLVVALVILAIMTSWQRGRAALRTLMLERLIPVGRLLDDIARRGVHRVSGSAVYLTSDDAGAPVALLHNLKINQIVHERNLFLTVHGAEIPYVAPGERLEIRELSPGFHRLVAAYGFMEQPDVPALLDRPEVLALGVEERDTSFILSRSQLVQASRSRLPSWRRGLYMLLARNAVDADRYFRLPPNRVLDIGMVVEI